MLPSCTPTFLHFPISLVFPCDADTESLRSEFAGRQQCSVRPVRVNKSTQELGSSSVSVGWDSNHVLWKRLFHLAVNRLINNTAVHCRDLVFPTEPFTK